ncbi:MAG: DUF4359 domain-containing protein [Xenococcaceae cyanobacterium]
MSIKNKLSLLTITIISGVMFFTNPEQKTYTRYASDRFAKEIPQAICQSKQLDNYFGDFAPKIISLCNLGLGLSLNPTQDLVESFLDRNTDRQNFFLFSIYTTKIPDHNFKTIGAIGNFITFSRG